MRELIDLSQAKDKDQFVMIRGYPRKVEYIRELQQRYSAKLIPDTQADLIRLLDHHIIVAKQKTGKWPEYIAMEREPMKWFIPIPYEIEYLGLSLMVYQKPAWFVCPRAIGVSVQKWRK
jgi:hypothetical protein